MIEIKNICKTYDNPNTESVVALDNVTLDFSSQGLVFVNGASGSGKTTLINILAGLDNPTSGEMFFEGNKISEHSEQEWDAYRNTEIGIVFQNFNLIDDLTVSENVLFPLKIQKTDTRCYEQRLNEVLDYVGLNGFADRKCNELSVGQKQRVAIARAIIKRPKVLLADEATGNLDPANTDSILNLFNDISKKCLVILISHDALSAKKYGDRIITISNGRIVGDEDNAKEKNLFTYPYNVTIQEGNSIKQATLNDFDLREEFASRAVWKEDHYGALQLDVVITPDNIECERIKIDWEREHVIRKKLSFREVMKHVAHNIKKNPARTGLVVAIICFVSLMSLICNLIAYNNYNMSVSQYMESKGYLFARVEKSTVKTGNDEETTLLKGKEFLQQLQMGIGEDKVIKCYEFYNVFYGTDLENYISVDLLSYTGNSVFDEGKLTGKWPEDKNQIVLDKGLAENCEISIGDYVLMEEIECEVVGLCSLVTNLESRYAVVSENIFDEKISCLDNVTMQSVDFTLSADKTNYAYGINSIGTVEQIKHKEESLVWGRMPQKDNEVLISSELAEQLGDYMNRDIITNFRIPDLHGDKYGQYYDDKINLYDYVGKTIEIVGVYEKYTIHPEIGNILFLDNIYKDILSDYINYLNYDYCMVAINGDKYGTVSELSNEDYYIVDSVCSYIYSLKNIVDELNVVIKVVLVVLFTVIGITLISFLNYNIKDQSRKIGILRAVGVERGDIRNIYLISNSLVNGFAQIISAILSVMVLKLVNKQISSMLMIGEFNMFIVNHSVIILLCLIIFVMGIVITILPLIQLSRDKSINLINHEV